MRTNSWIAILAALMLVLGACATSEKSSDGDSDPNCGTYPGVGTTPSSGSGTENDPFIGVVNTTYNGCAAEGADPGPVYGTSLSATSVSVIVTNYSSSANIELWIYDSNGTNLAVQDTGGGGSDETYSDSSVSPAGTYYAEVYNDGPGEAPFTIEAQQP